MQLLPNPQKPTRQTVPASLLLCCCLLLLFPSPVLTRNNLPEQKTRELIAPEHDTAHQPITQSASGNRDMVVTANAHATRAARDMLDRGGSAIDAAIAAQLVLGLVEPQSSGIGGGGFLLYFDASQQKTRFYDGRETAPAALVDDHFLIDGESMGFLDAVVGGHAVGVPGILHMLGKAHEAHGKLPWETLFTSAITLAEQGFRVSPRLHELLEKLPAKDNPAAFDAYFFRDGKAIASGELLVNPAYAKTLRLLAQSGAEGFYQGQLVNTMLESLSGSRRKSLLTAADFANYHSLERQPLCMDYRQYRVCGAAPPSSGGTTILAILGMLETVNLQALNEADFLHYFAEASRLAFADRELYLGDPSAMPFEASQLVDKTYLASRASVITAEERIETVTAGKPTGVQAESRAGLQTEQGSTTHLSIIDSEGNALSMTSSIEMAFGSREMAGGFLLNNQLTDFSFKPYTSSGEAIVNRPAAGKRPRSSMSPTIVFERGKPVLVTGSPGGARIIDYTALHLLRILDRKITAAEAMAMPHVIAMGQRFEIEPLESGYDQTLGEQLAAKNHQPVWQSQSSGLNTIELRGNHYIGSSDPRREGQASGR